MTEKKKTPVEIEQQMMARWIARVLGGEVVPGDPNVKREHLRLLYRDGDNTTQH